MNNRVTLLFILASHTIAQPNVDLIEPAFGGIGSTITISGNNLFIKPILHPTSPKCL